MWVVSTEEAGTAKVSYEEDRPNGSNKPDWKKKTGDGISIYLRGEITLDGDTLKVAFSN